MRPDSPAASGRRYDLRADLADKPVEEIIDRAVKFQELWIAAEDRWREGVIPWTAEINLGGRGAREFHAASCTSSIEAEKIADTIRTQIAGGRLERTSTSQREELVYFARLGDLIKIGVSVAPERRARGLNAELLCVEGGGRERERELHEAFARARVAGEWFRDDVRIRRYVESRPLPGEDAQAHKELGS